MAMQELIKKQVEAQKVVGQVVTKIYHNLGKVISTRRKDLDLSQEELAILTGFGRTSITNIEAGKQKILFHDLFIFAEVLETKPEQLIEDVREMG